MSRKVVRQINRFDGGITDDIRNTSDLSRCAHVSHFDIFASPYRLTPMPGYVADQDTTSGADDLQNYNVKAFWYDGTMRAVGTKSNGTGSKLWEKATPTTAEWTATSTGEGTDDLSDNTFLAEENRVYFATESGGSTYVSYYSGTVTDKAATLQSFSVSNRLIAERGIDDKLYINTGSDDLALLTSSSITDPVCNTVDRVVDFQSGDAQMGILGYNFYPYNTIFSIWDLTTNPNETLYRYDVGKGFPVALGRDGSRWLVVTHQGLNPDVAALQEQSNSDHFMTVHLTDGPNLEKLVTIKGATDTNAKFLPGRGTHHNAMLFYGRIPQDATPTTYKEGIWALGRRNSSSPVALSLLLDTSDLGSMEGYYTFGNHHFFAHGGDGSVSRLDTVDGTYDVTAVYESLMFGSETPYKKVFNGLSVLTEDLPSGASVVAKYRTDIDDSWTTLGTSNTTGDERHNFTRTSASMVGGFQEIQFRIEITGKASIKNITLSYDETDDLPFDA